MATKKSSQTLFVFPHPTFQLRSSTALQPEDLVHGVGAGFPQRQSPGAEIVVPTLVYPGSTQIRKGERIVTHSYPWGPTRGWFQGPQDLYKELM